MKDGLDLTKLITGQAGDTFGRRQTDLQGGRKCLCRGWCSCTVPYSTVKGSARTSRLRSDRRGGADS
jgi:hypothetical protein